MNASKTKTMIVSRSHTIHHQSPTLTVCGTVLKESDDVYILGFGGGWMICHFSNIKSILFFVN